MKCRALWVHCRGWPGQILGAIRPVAIAGEPGEILFQYCYFIILGRSESSDVIVISTDIKRRVGPSAIAELLVQITRIWQICPSFGWLRTKSFQFQVALPHWLLPLRGSVPWPRLVGSAPRLPLEARATRSPCSQTSHF